MKRLLLFIMSLFGVAQLSLAAMSDESQVSDIEFSATTCDFGVVPRQNRSYHCEFIYTNKGEKPIVVLGVQTSCSCLKADFSRRPVRPGEQGRIVIELEAAKVDDGVFHRVVKVQTNLGVSLLTVQGKSVPKR